MNRMLQFACRSFTFTLRDFITQPAKLLLCVVGLAVLSDLSSLALAQPAQAPKRMLETAELQIPRSGHTATRLADGTILIVGGENESGPIQASEIFDPVSGQFSFGPALLTARADHSAILLEDGRVLIAGGRIGDVRLNSTEIYDPSSKRFTEGHLLQRARSGQSVTRLSDDACLLVGGDDLGTTEVFYASASRFVLLDQHLTIARSLHTAALLLNGTVLVAGGI
jgi:hypothetical protein